MTLARSIFRTVACRRLLPTTPITNKGVRCDLGDYMVDVLGRSKATGNANSVLDNVGVEYGLQALDERKITPAQFVSLNESIGSFNGNFEWQPGRMEASLTGLRNAYRSGAVNEATFLNNVAIIDTPIDVQDIHEPYRSFAIRARLDAAHGSHASQVIWYTTTKTPNAFAVMNDWLTRVSDDHRPMSYAKKLVLDRPPAAHDMIDRTYNEGTREAAGGPLASDILACSLQPLSRSRFPVAFTDSQWKTLKATFPNGVCNWNKPGLEQQPTIPWLTYREGARWAAAGVGSTVETDTHELKRGKVVTESRAAIGSNTSGDAFLSGAGA